MSQMKIKVRESAFNADLPDNTANMDVFNTFMDVANSGYTIVVADASSKVKSVLKDYIDSGTTVVWWNAYVTVIPLLNEYDAKDIAEDLKSNGLEFCVYTQNYGIA